MSEDMSERMSEDMSERMSKDMSWLAWLCVNDTLHGSA